ncbi:MAG: metallophosphoesterase family protein, partial [Bacilli bacterium]|nr:metallophosphoesterase family protein [Bacilli bacterium]
YFNKAKDLNMMFDLFIEEFEFDICLFGHTHQYFKQKYRGKIFLNPGSIGQPTDTPTYKYCILEVSDKINIRLKEFEVKDIFWQLEKEYKSSSYYRENYVWASLILYAIRDSYDYSFLFLKLFNEKVNGQELTVDVFDKLWDETYKEFSKKFHLEE